MFWWISFSVDGIVCGGEAKLAFRRFRKIPSGGHQSGIRSLKSGEIVFLIQELGSIPFSVECVYACVKHTYSYHCFISLLTQAFYKKFPMHYVFRWQVQCTFLLCEQVSSWVFYYIKYSACSFFRLEMLSLSRMKV